MPFLWKYCNKDDGSSGYQWCYENKVCGQYSWPKKYKVGSPSSLALDNIALHCRLVLASSSLPSTSPRWWSTAPVGSSAVRATPRRTTASPTAAPRTLWRWRRVTASPWSSSLRPSAVPATQHGRTIWSPSVMATGPSYSTRARVSTLKCEVLYHDFSYRFQFNECGWCPGQLLHKHRQLEVLQGKSFLFPKELESLYCPQYLSVMEEEGYHLMYDAALEPLTFTNYDKVW